MMMSFHTWTGTGWMARVIIMTRDGWSLIRNQFDREHDFFPHSQKFSIRSAINEKKLLNNQRHRTKRPKVKKNARKSQFASSRLFLFLVFLLSSCKKILSFNWLIKTSRIAIWDYMVERKRKQLRSRRLLLFMSKQLLFETLNCLKKRSRRNPISLFSINI